MKAKVNYLGRRNFTKLYRDANFLSTLLTAGIVRTVSRLLSFLTSQLGFQLAGFFFVEM